MRTATIYPSLCRPYGYQEGLETLPRRLDPG